MRGGKRKLAAATAALQAKATAAALQEAVLDLANRKGVRCCVECHATSTPQWREGPMGPKTLCNACGVRRQRLLRKQQQASSGVAPTAPVAAVQARRRTSSRAQQMQALLTEDYVYGSASDASSEDTEMAGPWSSHDPHHRTASASALPGQLRAPSTRAVRSHHVVHVQHAQPRTHSDGHAAASRGQLHPHGYPSRDELPVLPHPYDYDYEHDLETRDDSGNEEESAAYDLLFFAGVDVESGAEGGARLPCSLSNPNPGPCSRPVRRRVTPRRYTEYERHEGAEEQEEQQQQRYAREVELEADETGFEGPEEVAEAGVAVERVPMVVASRKRRPAPPAGSLAIPPLHAMSSVNSGPDAPYAELSELQQLQQQQSRPVLIPSVPASSGPSTSGTSGLVLPPVSNSSHPASSVPNAPPSPLHMPLLASLPLLPLSIPDLAHAPLTAAALAPSAPAPVSLPTDSLPPLASLSSSAAAAPADAAALLRVWEDAQRAQAQLLEARSAQAAVAEVVEEQRQVAEAAQGEAVAASQRLMAEVRALADRYCLWAALAQLRAEGPAAAAAAPAAAVAPSGGADAAAATSDGTAAHPPAAAAALQPAVSVLADSC